MQSLILIGFDRSGTSAISRGLAMHPDVELIFRPFNSGPIRHKMYHIWDNHVASEMDKRFFKDFERGTLNSYYFVSQWHQKYSTIQDNFKNDKLHVVITNINHFTVKWVNKEFSNIEQWGIWRDPVDILNSCVKNNFYSDWYDDGLEKIFDSIRNCQELSSKFEGWIKEVRNSNSVIKTAYLIAVRNYFLFYHINKDKIINYDLFKKDPNTSLKNIVDHFKINKGFDFSACLNVDLNSIPSKDGYFLNKTNELSFNMENYDKVMEIFFPLYEVFESKKDVT